MADRAEILRTYGGKYNILNHYTYGTAKMSAPPTS